MSGDGSATDPKRLEGQSEDSRPRDFFWDSVTLYVVGVIIALAAIDVLTEFIRGSTLSCLISGDGSLGEANEDFINSFCAASVPRSEYFPAFIAVHGILIALPHYLWANHYGGNFEFFFSLVREMDRTRNEDTGTYSDKNRLILQQLMEAFTTYKQNWMFLLYTAKLTLQLCITVAGFIVAIFFFTDFNDVFLCPRDFTNSSDVTFPTTRWPFNTQVTCVFTSMQLFATIRIADLILLSLLILCFIWSLIWCFSTHPTELGTGKIASFCFQSGISPNYYVHYFPLNFCCDPCRKICRILFTSLPFFGAGPRVITNLDFLVLKLFRTDSGLGFVFHEMQILQEIKDHNDDDQRRANLHREQKKLEILQDGDIMEATVGKKHRHDLKWKFNAEGGDEGLYVSEAKTLQPDDILVLPHSLRGVVLGLSALSSRRQRAVFITFGSTSLGIPSALTRVFTKVGVLNFNPYFKKKGENGSFYISKIYCSQIIELSYPEDILAAEFTASNDFSVGLKKLWTPKIDTIDFLVIGPIEKKIHLSTLSLCLMKIGEDRFHEGSILLTICPKEVSSRPTHSEFHSYVPPTKYFMPFKQKVCLNQKICEDLDWPPKKPPNSKPLNVTSGHVFDFKLPCGDSQGRFKFGLFKYVNDEDDEDDSEIEENKTTVAVDMPV